MVEIARLVLLCYQQISCSVNHMIVDDGWRTRQIQRQPDSLRKREYRDQRAIPKWNQANNRQQSMTNLVQLHFPSASWGSHSGSDTMTRLFIEQLVERGTNPEIPRLNRFCLELATATSSFMDPRVYLWVNPNITDNATNRHTLALISDFYARLLVESGSLTITPRAMCCSEECRSEWSWQGRWSRCTTTGSPQCRRGRCNWRSQL